VRVIAGQARGRLLKSPASRYVRPTGDKVKGALFSLLEALAFKRGYEPQVDEQVNERFAVARAWPRVLDLYAGSGALGIEALSRGAEHADFVESDPRARALIEANLRLTGLHTRATVHALRAEQAVSTLGGSYDLILADPPYADAEAARAVASIAASPRVTDSTVLVWEHRADYRPPSGLGRLRLRRTRRHGIAALSLYTGELDDRQPVQGADAEQPGA
jgi:16S rRNA (guanine966-N2)-methyltransferase